MNQQGGQFVIYQLENQPFNQREGQKIISQLVNQMRVSMQQADQWMNQTHQDGQYANQLEESQISLPSVQRSIKEIPKRKDRKQEDGSSKESSLEEKMKSTKSIPLKGSKSKLLLGRIR